MQYIQIFMTVLIDVLSFAIIGRVIFSWLSPSQRRGQFYRVLVEMTDPVLNVFKKIVPRTGMLDFTPLIALIALDVLRRLMISIF